MNENEVQNKRRQNEEEATARRARILGLVYLDTRDFENDIPLVTNVLEKEQMHKECIIPLQKGQEGLPYQFMVTSQTPRSTIEKMAHEYNDAGLRIEFYLISNSAYQVFMLRHDPPQQVHYDDIEIAKEGDSETLASVSQTLDSVSTEKVFDYLLDQADKLGASDIHIENLRNAIRIRMRVDGILHPVAEISRDRYRIFMGELSSRASVSIASTKPQSGHMQKDITRDGATHLLNIRVEMVPTMYGQDAVLRLFNFDESLLNLDLLGITKEERNTIDEMISHPRGLLLMVGPTGSGKSTTLYASIREILDSTINISTMEDPVELNIDGVNQGQINNAAGFTFAAGIRALLRQDPDVIMIGEMRDQETSSMAIEAALTGHLVFSTLHTNDAAGAFPRLLEMGLEPFLVSTAIKGVLAQRLVRRICKYCKEPVEISASLREELHLSPDMQFYHGKGCEKCDGSGYKGRCGIYEFLVPNETVRNLIIKRSSGDVIKRAAMQECDMITLRMDGIQKALDGHTTLEQAISASAADDV